jgi:hypothetical protein
MTVSLPASKVSVRGPRANQRRDDHSIVTECQVRCRSPDRDRECWSQAHDRAQGRNKETVREAMNVASSRRPRRLNFLNMM